MESPIEQMWQSAIFICFLLFSFPALAQMDPQDPRSNGNGGWSSSAYHQDNVRSATDQGVNNANSWSSGQQATYLENSGNVDKKARKAAGMSTSASDFASGNGYNPSNSRLAGQGEQRSSSRNPSSSSSGPSSGPTADPTSSEFSPGAGYVPDAPQGLPCGHQCDSPDITGTDQDLSSAFQFYSDRLPAADGFESHTERLRETLEIYRVALKAHNRAGAQAYTDWVDRNQGTSIQDASRNIEAVKQRRRTGDLAYFKSVAEQYHSKGRDTGATPLPTGPLSRARKNQVIAGNEKARFQENFFNNTRGRQFEWTEDLSPEEIKKLVSNEVYEYLYDKYWEEVPSVYEYSEEQINEMAHDHLKELAKMAFRDGIIDSAFREGNLKFSSVDDLPAEYFSEAARTELPPLGKTGAKATMVVTVPYSEDLNYLAGGETNQRTLGISSPSVILDGGLILIAEEDVKQDPSSLSISDVITHELIHAGTKTTLAIARKKLYEEFGDPSRREFLRDVVEAATISFHQRDSRVIIRRNGIEKEVYVNGYLSNPDEVRAYNSTQAERQAYEQLLEANGIQASDVPLVVEALRNRPTQVRTTEILNQAATEFQKEF